MLHCLYFDSPLFRFIQERCVFFVSIPIHPHPPSILSSLTHLTFDNLTPYVQFTISGAVGDCQVNIKYLVFPLQTNQPISQSTPPADISLCVPSMVGTIKRLTWVLVLPKEIHSNIFKLYRFRRNMDCSIVPSQKTMGFILTHCWRSVVARSLSASRVSVRVERPRFFDNCKFASQTSFVRSLIFRSPFVKDFYHQTSPHPRRRRAVPFTPLRLLPLLNSSIPAYKSLQLASLKAIKCVPRQ